MRNLAELGAGLDRVREILARLDEKERAGVEAAWRARAACRNVPVSLFFPNGDDERVTIGDYDQARRICETCLVWELCLSRHLKEGSGCFAGTTPHERLTFDGNGARRPERGQAHEGS